MNESHLIILNGRSASGKTTLGKQIAKEHQIIFISKDEIKELLFDSLGYSDTQWSKKIGAASFDILFLNLEKHITAKNTCVIDGAFNSELSKNRLLDLQKKYQFKALQINCEASKETRRERFERRVVSGERHPGHQDLERIKANDYDAMKDGVDTLPIIGDIATLDMNDFNKIDYTGLNNIIRNFVGKNK
jgi:predicted kinase